MGLAYCDGILAPQRARTSIFQTHVVDDGAVAAVQVRDGPFSAVGLVVDATMSCGDFIVGQYNFCGWDLIPSAHQYVGGRNAFKRLFVVWTAANGHSKGHGYSRGNVLKKVVERYEVVCCVRRKLYLILKEIELRVDLEEYLDEIPNSLYIHD